MRNNEAIRRIIGMRFERAYRLAKLITTRQRQWARTIKGGDHA